jgi:hypothetical protein
MDRIGVDSMNCQDISIIRDREREREYRLWKKEIAFFRAGALAFSADINKGFING